MENALIVDVDLGDVFLLRNALLEAGTQHVGSVTAVEPAARYMLALPPYSARKLPELIFLDLNMGGLAGLEFLSWLKRRPEFQNIPVIILSLSSNPIDKFKALQFGAKAVFRKTLDAERMKAIVQKVFDLLLDPPPKVPTQRRWSEPVLQV